MIQYVFAFRDLPEKMPFCTLDIKFLSHKCVAGCLWDGAKALLDILVILLGLQLAGK